MKSNELITHMWLSTRGFSIYGMSILSRFIDHYEMAHTFPSMECQLMTKHCYCCQQWLVEAASLILCSYERASTVRYGAAWFKLSCERRPNCAGTEKRGGREEEERATSLFVSCCVGGSKRPHAVYTQATTGACTYHGLGELELQSNSCRPW